ncbi:hypothetical protein SUGI_0642300 [Cryptomeria japonica]|nr:hypothetical protein SUGI_0642300 [Cryptomeria japonica]
MGELKQLVEEGKINMWVCQKPLLQQSVEPMQCIQSLQCSLNGLCGVGILRPKLFPPAGSWGLGLLHNSPLGRGFFASGTKLLESVTDYDYRKV